MTTFRYCVFYYGYYSTLIYILQEEDAECYSVPFLCPFFICKKVPQNISIYGEILTFYSSVSLFCRVFFKTFIYLFLFFTYICINKKGTKGTETRKPLIYGKIQRDVLWDVFVFASLFWCKKVPETCRAYFHPYSCKFICVTFLILLLFFVDTMPQR